MNLCIRPAVLAGPVTPPPSKSAAHRALICAALAAGRSVLTPAVPSRDIDATIRAVKSLGARIAVADRRITVEGIGGRPQEAPKEPIDCGESGSTLRFLIPVAALSGGPVTFTGHGRLPQRPIGPYLDCLPAAGVACRTEGGLPLTVAGPLRAGEFCLPGNVSSQFVTGLLLALPLLPGDSRIRLLSPLESAGYVDMTVAAMARHGVTVRPTADGYAVPGRQTYRPCDTAVESDWSQAAFWLAAGGLGGPVTCRGMNRASRQGDRAIAEILTRSGARLTADGPRVTAAAQNRRGFSVDAGQIPDLVPILAVYACFCDSPSEITGAGRLRIKESDRLHAMTMGLRALGADIAEQPDGLRIRPAGPLPGGRADTAGDHRIAMALSVAAAYGTGPSVLCGCECVEKSYPEFFTDFRKLGGIADVVDVG